MLRSFDHLVMVSDDLERDAGTFRKAGFSITRRDDLPGGPTQNLLICLSDGAYIELFSFKDMAYRAGHRWRDATPGAWTDYGLATTELADVVTRLRRAGIVVPEPTDFRKTLADGVSWACRTTHPAYGQGAIMLPFLVQDLTPRHLRVPQQNCRHQNGARTIAGCTIVTHDLMAATAALGTLCPDNRRMAADRWRFGFANHWIDVVCPQDSQSEAGQHLQMHGDGLWNVTLVSDHSHGTFIVGQARIAIIDPRDDTLSNAI